MPAQLPPGPPLFTGRTDESYRLAASRNAGSSPLVVAPDGPAAWANRPWPASTPSRPGFSGGRLYRDLHGKQPAAAVRALLDGEGLRPPRPASTSDAQVGLYRSLTADIVRPPSGGEPVGGGPADEIIELCGRSPPGGLMEQGWGNRPGWLRPPRGR
ncbi:hypothetical protein Aab01nite_12080 [Paractinoplanes abujensis]|nr:hypothetical protein Aab01nite_12080 [Actinoplanes abujensis]